MTKNFDKFCSRFLLESVNDEEYLTLASDPEKNKVELQRMVGDTAKEKNYNIGPVFHGSHIKGIREFYGGWWSASKSVTREFGNQLYAGYLHGPFADGKQLRELYIEYNGKDDDFDSEESLTDSDLGDAAMSGGPFSRFVQERGFKGIEVWDDSNSESDMAYSVFEPSQIKSADPVTYDDGNIIPLSQRFDSSKDDIRY